MKIEGRIKKPYSEKLFNELCFLYLLIDGDKAYNYILNKKIQQSYRTYHRYAKELHECGLTPPIHRHNKSKEEKDFGYFSFENINLGNYEKVEFLEGYIQGRKIDNEGHMKRLHRVGSLLIENLFSYHEDWDDNDGGYIFESFSNNLYNNKTSLRTYQRDIKLVKDVILHMYEY